MHSEKPLMTMALMRSQRQDNIAMRLASALTVKHVPITIDDVACVQTHAENVEELRKTRLIIYGLLAIRNPVT